MPRRKRDQNGETNWSLRDNVSWYADQVRAAPGAVRALAGVPGGLLRGVRDMAADMRSAPPAIPPGDPSLAPIDGVTFAMLVRATAAGAPLPEAARSAWEQRVAQDPRLAEAFAWAVRAETAQRSLG